MPRLHHWATVALLLCFATPSAGAIISCEYDNWGGTKNKGIVKTWLGTTATIDTTKGAAMITRVDGDGDWSASFQIHRVREAKKFTTYVFYVKQEDAKNVRLNSTYSLRAYKDGTGQARMSTPGYRDIWATGTCK